jgi:hypothetical protein
MLLLLLPVGTAAAAALLLICSKCGEVGFRIIRYYWIYYIPDIIVAFISFARSNFALLYLTDIEATNAVMIIKWEFAIISTT